MKREVWIPLAAGLFLLGSIIPNEVCRSVWKRYGIGIPECPDGSLRQTAELRVENVRRLAKGRVTLAGTAHYTVHDADGVQHAPVRRFEAIELSLVDAKGKATPLAVEWADRDATRSAELTLPDVPDGDYQLVARYTTALGDGTVELPLPLYTPAQVHVLTDRPLYEPGNVVQFRALALRARDLGPLDGRPGKWIVKDPSGEVVLEEAAAAGDWGVVAGTFPLDRGAPTGTWHVAWSSHESTDEVPFTVEPFTLPRFRVEAAAGRPFYGVGDVPTLAGAVVYSSGAPVARAKLDIQWAIAGAWPAPADWLETALPKQAVTSATGRFELALPKVPADLIGKVTLTAQIAAVDTAGDRVATSAVVLLSQDGIEATAVTELDDGLIENFNNRLYVRVTTPDGRVLPKTKLRVRRTWQPNDNGIEAESDEDGVASLQIDPGAPVNIVIPALPYRPPPRGALVARGEAQEMIGGEGASLADQVELDRWLPALAPCAKLADPEQATARVAMRIAPSGAVTSSAAGPGALAQCAAAVVRGKRLPAGGDRLIAVDFSFQDPLLPVLNADVDSALGAVPDELAHALPGLARTTRDCLPRTTGELPRLVAWRVRAGTKHVELGDWSRDPRVESAALEPAMACVTARLAGARIALDEVASQDQLGVVRFAIDVPEGPDAGARPQPTTLLGYELDVSAAIEGSDQRASTKLRLTPGRVPALRMRVTPVVAKPGEAVTAQLIRGPDFTGTLPKELAIECLRWKQAEVPLGVGNTATVTIDPSVEGWCEIRGGGVHGRVYVMPKAELAVEVTPKQPAYRPGQRAELAIRTRVGKEPGKAAVGLFGVDASLGQIATLRGPDDLARVRPKVETSSPAFGSLDGQALSLGRIRGANAAAATVLRVSAIPKAPDLDAQVSGAATTRFDPVAELTDHFYVVLAELHAQVRAWEAKAPAGEKMQPATMARLWNQALDACERRGQPTTDAYGRRLRLRLLPADLLALTDPRAVVVVGTRLPEDVENWTQWVEKARP